MRTARFSCRLGGEGVYLGGVSQGVYIPPVNRMTHRCKNITLPQTSFAGGNKIYICKSCLLSNLKRTHSWERHQKRAELLLNGKVFFFTIELNLVISIFIDLSEHFINILERQSCSDQFWNFTKITTIDVTASIKKKQISALIILFSWVYTVFIYSHCHQ